MSCLNRGVAVTRGKTSCWPAWPATRKKAIEPPTRRAWHCFEAGALAEGAAQAVNISLEVPSPQIYQACFLMVFTPFFMAW